MSENTAVVNTAIADITLISTLINRWAEAVHAGDIDAVVADHSPDIVMFDVPPPDNGVRGIDEYRQSWPPFFRWQASGRRSTSST